MLIVTMFASLVAAGGLGASAWTGYYQVEVSKDQLAQSTEDSERDRQQQAALISTWLQEDKKGDAIAYFANRSRDPISQVAVGVATGSDGQLQIGEYGHRKMLLDLSDVLPCSRITIPASAAPAQFGAFAIAGFSFVDTQGQRWGRATYKPLQAMNLPSSGDSFHNRYMATWKLIFGNAEKGQMRPERPGSPHSHLPAPEPLKDCGSDSK
ncbi:hypothetical protein ACIBL6_08935 [Streptomyces sp. NPDC050400]|uniref:hypothetical protein n=1 Tax=Streptomyces sp. NPDC050400 TaxID=3365610 RepID=UPI0037B13608